jgi:hypothetical protein
MPARIAQNFFQVKCLGCLSLGGPMGPGARQPASWSLVGGGVGQPREPSTAARKAGQQDDGEETKKPSGQGDSAPLAWRLLRGRRFASHSDKLGHTLTKTRHTTMPSKPYPVALSIGIRIAWGFSVPASALTNRGVCTDEKETRKSDEH